MGWDAVNPEKYESDTKLLKRKTHIFSRGVKQRNSIRKRSFGQRHRKHPAPFLIRSLSVPFIRSSLAASHFYRRNKTTLKKMQCKCTYLLFISHQQRSGRASGKKASNKNVERHKEIKRSCNHFFSSLRTKTMYFQINHPRRSLSLTPSCALFSLLFLFLTRLSAIFPYIYFHRVCLCFTMALVVASNACVPNGPNNNQNT